MPTNENLLKKIRTRLNLTQSELAGTDMTRNIISMIENGKTPLTLRTAETLAERMNQLTDSRFRIQSSDLLIPGLFNARLETMTLTETFRASHNELHFNLYIYLSRFSELFSRWPLTEEKYEAFYAIGEHFLARNQAEEAQLYFSRSYENAQYLSSPVALARAALALATAAFRAGQFQSVILTVEGLKVYEERVPSEQLLRAFLYQTLAYDAGHDYEKAIDSLTFMEHLVQPEQIRWQQWIQLMKAQCYAGKGMFGIASRILNTLEMQWQNDRSHLLHLPASITCLRLRMDPTGPEAERLMDCWETFRQNPSSGSESAILYVRFLEAALQTRNKILIAPVVWQGVNMLSLPDYGTEMRRLMQLALEAWTRYPELELANHWLHYLTRLASPMAEQDFHLIFQYLKFFSTTGKAPLTDATLSRVQLTGINR